MTASLPLTNHYKAQHECMAERLAGQGLAWLDDKRASALARFNCSGFPSPREEEWRYTNIAPIERKMFTPYRGDVQNVDPGLLSQYQLQDAITLVFVDGYWNQDLSASLDGLPEGVIISSIATALVDTPEQVESAFDRIAKQAQHSFIDFNTAFFTDGAFVSIAEQQVLERPIQLLYINSQNESLAAVRNLIMVEKGAQAQLVETFVGVDTLGYLTAAVSEVRVAENAKLSYTKLQAESEKAFHFGGLYVNQQRYGRFNHQSFSFGGLLVRNEIHTDLDEGSECELNGLYLATQRQHVDNHTRIEHQQPHAISRETYKGILDQRARGVFQGRIVVAEDAQKTDSDMHNRNLLLSDKAEVDTKPQLEIYADDVQCAHGVTVGQLEEASVFYLRSRGIDEETARNMLTFAFANEMVEKIELSALKASVQTELLQRFPQAGVRKEWL